MTSGIPFSRGEIDFVKANINEKFPSVIARGLALKFREYNKGYRSTDSVRDLMARIIQGLEPNPQLRAAPPTKEEPPVITIPDLRKGAPKPRKKKNNI